MNHWSRLLEMPREKTQRVSTSESVEIPLKGLKDFPEGSWGFHFSVPGDSTVGRLLEIPL